MRIDVWPAVTGTKVMSSYAYSGFFLSLLFLSSFFCAGSAAGAVAAAAPSATTRPPKPPDPPPPPRVPAAPRRKLGRIQGDGEGHVLLVALRLQEVLAHPRRRQIVRRRLARAHI